MFNVVQESILRGMLVAQLFNIASFATLMAATAAWAQEAVVTPTLAPMNPRFVEYQNGRANGSINGLRFSPYGHPLGHLPAPMDLSHLKGRPGLAAQAGISLRGQAGLADQAGISLPSKFDLRDYGKVSPVKDQQSCGDCWAFATYGSMESVLLGNESWNFSENNLNNLHGFDAAACAGGNGNKSTAYLARWAGPINASDDPDSSTSTPSPQNLLPQKHVQGVYFIAPRANSTDNDSLKTAIMLYGGVMAAISADELDGSNPYWNDSNSAYYYDGATVCDGSECPVDHDITLVGWDDNYPAGNFSTAPPGNGAFLVKASYGTSFGANGFFWISYYDVQLATITSYVFDDNASTTNYTTKYEYDPLGLIASTGYNGSTNAWAANIFTASANGQLTAVATYALVNSTAYTITIYTNASNGPTSGSQATTASGTISLAGYNTIVLPTPVAITKGQQFSVVIKLTTPGYEYPVPIEYAIAGYSSKATASPGQSYISPDGSSWADMTTTTSTQNLALKAFSNDSTEPTLSAALTSTAASGIFPLATTFTASAGGTATGSINYSIWWDCSDMGTSVSSVEAVCGSLSSTCSSTATGFKCDGQSQSSYTVSHTYSTAGRYIAKVIVERGSAPPAEAHTTIQVIPVQRAATPAFSPAAGAYSVAQTVIITSPIANATIYYTTDGSTPTSASTKYASALIVSTSETLHAIAIASGYDGSAVATAAYTIAPPVSIGRWTWMGGSSTGIDERSLPGVYGTLGAFASENVPRSRALGAVSWTDKNGNLWLFGGLSYDSAGWLVSLNDLWEMNPATKQWAWMGGSNLGDQSGIYGTMGVAADANVPGGRWGAEGWTDKDGNLWLYGGFGRDSAGQKGTLSDLWEFSPSTRQWTWIGGSSLVDQSAVYGTLGVGSSTTTPGSRDAATSWTDKDGNFWLFSGSNFGYSNDIWEFKPSTKQWVWIGGSNIKNLCGVYGTKGVAASGNAPGRREYTQSWTDRDGNLWLFGGEGPDSVGNWGELSDLWEFNTSTHQWTWAGGSNLRNQIPVYGILGVASSANTPGGREFATSWTDKDGTFWLFGGQGPDYKVFNDLWKFDPSAMEWMWVGGSSVGNQAGTYGSLGVADQKNTPGARSGTAGWNDISGNFWIFGGDGYDRSGMSAELNDVWEFQYFAATPAFDVAAGTYSSAQTVTISDTTPSATIYYTTDGSTPTSSSTKYTAAIAISATETLQAFATASGYSNSAVATAAYTITIPNRGMAPPRWIPPHPQQPGLRSGKPRLP